MGGGLSRAGATLTDPLVAAIERHLAWREAPRVVTARFADDAGFVGCAIRAWKDVAGLDVADLAGVLDADTWRSPRTDDPVAPAPAGTPLR